MNQGDGTGLRLVAGIAIFAAAVMLGLAVYNYLQTPAARNEVVTEPTPKEIMPVRNSTPTIGKEYSAGDIESANLDTNYKDYFPESDKCRQSYNEMFGDKTGGFSPNSACSISITFEKNGNADKSIVIRKFDAGSGKWKDHESAQWSGTITADRFERLAATITANEAFKNWNENVSLTARNSMITVKYADGNTRSPMSNVDAKTAVFLEMIDAFAALDRETKWTPKK